MLNFKDFIKNQKIGYKLIYVNWIYSIKSPSHAPLKTARDWNPLGRLGPPWWWILYAWSSFRIIQEDLTNGYSTFVWIA